MIPDIVTVGSMAVDSITTPVGEAPNCLGGAAVHGSIAASMFARVGLVGVVGTDYPQEGWDLLNARNIDISAFSRCRAKPSSGKVRTAVIWERPRARLPA